MDTPTPRRRKDGVSATLHKPVAALAIVPLNRSLTVTARKAYNVMLHLAQREGDTGDLGFSAPLNAILRGFGVGSNVSADAKRYIDQMTTTKIEWRPLSAGEQWQLTQAPDAQPADTLPEPHGLPSGRDERDDRDELRIFNMLAEVRLYKKAGENWVTWFYPPTIKEQMLGPQRWARLELEVIARLSTYTAVALYEICARYRDNPGGVTSRHPWHWWVQVLKGSEAGKQREWRKFKNEFVNPAIREINSASDIELELLEYKQGRAIADVQFGVRRKPALSWADPPEAPDVSQVLRALRLGLREGDADALQERYGAAAMTSALDAMERTVAAQGANPILNKAAYLKTILAGQANGPSPQAAATGLRLASGGRPTGAQPGGFAAATQAAAALGLGGSGGLGGAGQAGAPGPSSSGLGSGARQAMADAPGSANPSAVQPGEPRPPLTLAGAGDELRAERQAQARQAFEGLSPAEQADWTRRLRDHLVGQGNASLVVVRRLDAGQWQSPLVKAMMIRYYAQQVHGEAWLQGRAA